MKPLIAKHPLFLYLLPVFFVWHGFTENDDLVTIQEFMILAAIYTAIALSISFLAWLFYRNYVKACLLAFSVLSVHFFFGSLHDFLKKNLAGSFLVRYSFLIPAILITLLLIAFILKRSKKPHLRITSFLNLLFILLLLADLASLTVKKINRKEYPISSVAGSLTVCDTCAKPDIYLIVADEYAGYDELRDIFRFSNDSFETQLTNRGFYVAQKSISNYNRTIYSMASCLNMNYLQGLKRRDENNMDIAHCNDLIGKNDLLTFLKRLGYEIYNYSFFDLRDNPRLNNPHIVYSGQKLITSQTFINRLIRDIGFNFRSKSAIKRRINFHLYSNLKTDSLTRLIAKKNNNSTPRFVYSHFMMPHPPYYFDRQGKESDYNKLLNDEYAKSEKHAYLEYLLYTNNYLLGLIDQIKSSSSGKSIIILMSDHGFRQFEEDEKVDQKYHFMNLNAVFMPDGDYSGFYDGLSNVNQFRVILNTQFGQKLPILKDSASYIWDH